MPEHFNLILCVLLGMAVVRPAAGQNVNLEELEGRLRREQAAESARQAEANRKAEASRKAEAARRTAEAAQGTLIVRADAVCSLRINTQDKGFLSANRSQTMKVNPGEQLIECDAGDGRLAEAVETVPTGEQRVVRLTVPPPARFVRVVDGVQDNTQGIVWAGSDNGSDIDWNGAHSYCSDKGDGWSLPTVAQAQSMFDATGQYPQPSSNQYGNWTIQPATDVIRLSQGTAWLWTSERDDSSSAFSIKLTNGTRNSNPVSHSNNERALCVRRPTSPRFQ